MNDSNSANISVEAVDERVLTADDLSKMFNVSPKTIRRWHKRGLAGGRVVLDGRKRLGFLESSVNRFVRRHPQRVARGARFRRLSDVERRRIIDRARRLAGEGFSAGEVITKLTEETGRSDQTIRSTIRRFDKRHPQRAVFPNAGPLDEATKESIYTRYRAGTSVSSLAKRFHRSQSMIRQIIRRMRARRIFELPLKYVPSPEFEEPKAERWILGPPPQPVRTARRARPPAGLPPYLAALYEVPLLTAEQESHLFRKYNFLKFRAARMRKRLAPQKPRSRLMDQIERLYDEAVTTKNQIIRANLRLVVSVAKRLVKNTDEFFDLVSDGNTSLMRAVEKFDYTRGFKFSTYATWAIKRNLASAFVREMKHRDRFRTRPDELMMDEPEYRADPHEQLRAQQLREAQVNKMLDRLSDRERHIIELRFGLASSEHPMMLREVADEFGISKERIRQLERRALKKLRQAAVEQNVDRPD
jgi:RNA polymerase primary sigma factor/RNA polymerase sigma factor